jgi:hypothetical protein
MAMVEGMEAKMDRTEHAIQKLLEGSNAADCHGMQAAQLATCSIMLQMLHYCNILGHAACCMLHAAILHAVGLPPLS